MKEMIYKVLSGEFNESDYGLLVLNLFNNFDFSKRRSISHLFSEAERQTISDLIYLGSYEDSQNKSLDVLIVELKSKIKVERARGFQRNLIGKYLKTGLKDAALVAFYSKDNLDWRLSFMKIDYRIDERGVKVEIGTPPKRYSFLVGKTEPTHTAQKQFLPLLDDRRVPTIDEIEGVFSIEKVTKEFYVEIAKKFTELVGGEIKIGAVKTLKQGCIKLPSTDDAIVKKEFAVRLLGRLLFCWFLKKKRSEAGEGLLTNLLVSSDAVNREKGYYHKILEPLFFQVLNTPHPKRREDFKQDFWAKIPFLNGGLFEPGPGDFYEVAEPFGYSKYINTLEIPDEWFLGLFKIFELYNFTIDESTTIDIDISVDPEMLGRIFENLLAEINPETGETARKATGSYYTPRSIVEYMVDESLKRYLLAQFEHTEWALEIETKIFSLLSYAESTVYLSEEEKNLIIDALDKIKIIDLACGSGAFPMGILHKILHVLQKIDSESKEWLKIKLARIDNRALKNELETKLKSENWDYVHKLGIIQNSIYGIDIQPIAVEISKLRFFLSLIVDEKIDDAKPNRGILALPNLEFKFLAANSLINLSKAGELSESASDIESLKELRDRYFIAFGDEKREIEAEFSQIQKRMFLHALNWQATNSQILMLSNWDPFTDTAASWFDPEWMFGVSDGFDIVIGNPPYLQLQKLKNDPLQAAYKREGYETYDSNGDIYGLFYERGLKILKEGGFLAFITSNKWMRAAYGAKLRAFFAGQNPLVLIDLGPGVFESATVDTNILITERAKNRGELKALTYLKGDRTLLEAVAVGGVALKNLGSDAWFIGGAAAQGLKEKIERLGRPLKDWDVKINYGIKTGLNEAFIIDTATKERLCQEDPKSAEILKPVLRGRDIKRYGYDWAQKWLIQSGFDIDVPNEYPAIFNHLLQFEEKARKRDDQGQNWWNLRACAYYGEFAKEKVVWPRLMRVHKTEDVSFPRFSIAPAGAFVADSLCIITGSNLYYLISVLNSKYGESYFRKNIAILDNGGMQMRQQYIENIPIPPITPQNQPLVSKIETLVEEILAAKKQNPPANTVLQENQIDQLVYQLYDLTEEEIKIVEDKE